jgi:glycosyltransferase involved in cell wall biosynthesis
MTTKRKIVLVIPVYNEQDVLEDSIRKLHHYMSKNIKDDWTVVIANNASTDNTQNTIDHLVKNFHNVQSVHLNIKGRGIALKKVLGSYDADVCAYCDVDLATDIIHLKQLFYEILDGKNNIVIGSRYLRSSRIRRTLKRFILSKGYNYLIRLFFKTKIKDFQCGFKAVDNRIVKELLPKVKDKRWFFDTELLIRAEQSKKYKIKEIPVRWHENNIKTNVHIFNTISTYIVNLIKLRFEL